MKILNCEQRSEEWFNARKLKMTASKAAAIGNCGAGLKTYIRELCYDYFAFPYEKYINEAMERGQELEDEARAIYELEKGVEVKQVGLVLYNDYVACSPDGFVGDEGLTEYKAMNKKHLDLLLDDKIDSSQKETFEKEYTINDLSI